MGPLAEVSCNLVEIATSKDFGPITFEYLHNNLDHDLSFHAHLGTKSEFYSSPLPTRSSVRGSQMQY